MSSKISALTDGNPVVGTDILPYARGAGNVRGTTDELADYIALVTLFDVFDGALRVQAATTAVLAGSPTYANGAAGVGATLTKGSNGAFPSQDGVASVVGNRYLVKNQASALQNGVYELTTLGTAGSTPWVLTRTTDSDLNTELDAQIVIPGAGAVNKRFVFNQTTPLPTIGTSNIVYAQTAATAGLGIPLTRTVAQMQTLAAASGFNTGRSYIISNIQVADCTCSAMFTALSTSTISTTGNGTFLNAAMSAAVAVTIEYTLATDKIKEIYVAGTNILATSEYNLAVITSWPFDSANILAGVVRDPLVVSVSPTANCIEFIFEGYNSITMSAGSTFEGRSDIASTLQLAGTASYSGSIGVGATLKMYGTQNLTSCTIGDGKSADFNQAGKILDSYTRTGKTYAGNFSDFDVSLADEIVTTTLDMAANGGIINMAIFPWAGILKVSGDNTQKLNEFTSFPIDHPWTVIPDNGTVALPVLINSFPNGGTNIYLETNTFITLQGTVNPVDRAVFQADEQDNTMVVKIGGANYVI